MSSRVVGDKKYRKSLFSKVDFKIFIYGINFKDNKKDSKTNWRFCNHENVYKFLGKQNVPTGLIFENKRKQ